MDEHPNAPGGNGGDEKQQPEARVPARVPAALEEQTLAGELSRVEIDQSIATAHRFPRRLDVVMRKVEELALYNEAAAENSMYALPPRDGKVLVGPSIGFANIVASSWGNCRVGSRIIGVDLTRKVIIAEGVFHDLESNVMTIRPVNRQIVSSKGMMYPTHLQITTGMAAASIAVRNATLHGVPRAVWFPAWERALYIVRGTEATLPQRRAKALSALQEHGIDPKKLFMFLGVRNESEIGVEHMPTLRGMYAQLRDGSITAEEMLDPRQMVGGTFETVENPLADEDPRAGAGEPAGGHGAGTAPGTARTAKPASGQKTKAAKPSAKGKAPDKPAAEPKAVEPAKPAEEPAKPTEPAKPKAPEAKPSKVPPKTSAEYKAHAEAFIAAATSVSGLEDAWKSERTLRGTCGVIEEEFDTLKKQYDAKLAELRGTA